MADNIQINKLEQETERKTVQVIERGQVQKTGQKSGGGRSLLGVIGYVLLVLIPGLLGYLNLIEKHADIKFEVTVHYAVFGLVFVCLFFLFVTVLGGTANKPKALLLTITAMLMCGVTWLLSNPDYVAFGEKTISTSVKQAVTKVTGFNIKEQGHRHSAAGLNFNLRCEKVANEARCNLKIENTTNEVVHISNLDRISYTSAGAYSVNTFLINGHRSSRTQDNLAIKAGGSRNFPVLVIYDNDDVSLNDLTLFFEISKDRQKIKKFALPK